MKVSHKLLAIVATLATALGLGATGQATAAPQGNIVTIADSFGANPDQKSYFLSALFPTPPGTPFKDGCQQSATNWPRKLSQQLAIPVTDWSCAGMTTHKALQRVDNAIRTGDIHPGTRAVIFSVGMNDYGPPGIRDGYAVTDYGSIRAAMFQDMRVAASRIRAINPNIRIIIAGFPAISNPAGGVCLLNIIPNVPLGLPMPMVHTVELQHRINQIDVARNIGAQFIDVRNQTLSHDTCAPDSSRWVSGLIDTTASPRQMFLHPTDLGNDNLARIISGAFR